MCDDAERRHESHSLALRVCISPAQVEHVAALPGRVFDAAFQWGRLASFLLALGIAKLPELPAVSIAVRRLVVVAIGLPDARGKLGLLIALNAEVAGVAVLLGTVRVRTANLRERGARDAAADIGKKSDAHALRSLYRWSSGFSRL